MPGTPEINWSSIKRLMALTINGGGLKGGIPAYQCLTIENLTKMKTNQLFSFFSGSSVGAMECSFLAAGVPAETVFNTINTDGPGLFTEQAFFKRWFVDPGHAKYTRKALYDRSEQMLKDAGVVYFGDYKVPVMLTGYGLKASRTHLLKSWDPEHAKYKAVDVMSWSALSAVIYFGEISAPNFVWKDTFQGQKIYTGERFEDGGQGLLNCTAGTSTDIIFESEIGWKKEDNVYMLNLGCGNTLARDNSNPGMIGQIWKYLAGGDGGEARTEAEAEEIKRASERFRSEYGDDSHFCSVDPVIDKEIDLIDGKQFMSRYAEIAQKIITWLPDFAINPRPL